MKKLYIIILMSILGIVNATASTSVGSTKASATLSALCEVSVTDISFGTINQTANNNASGKISVMCTKNTSYAVRIIYESVGQGSTEGMMLVDKSAFVPNYTDTILYYISLPTSSSTLWGSTTSNGTAVNGVATGTIQTINMPAVAFTSQGNGQNGGATYSYITPGNYTASATVSITY